MMRAFGARRVYRVAVMDALGAKRVESPDW